MFMGRCIVNQCQKQSNKMRLCTVFHSLQEVTEIKTKLEIKSKPQPLHQQRNPVDIQQVEYHLHLQQNVLKGETETETLRHLALETMNTRYPQAWITMDVVRGVQPDH